MSVPIAVVHLVREANGLAPLRAFLDSYRRHEAGRPHDLVLLLKGFGSDAAAARHLACAADEAPHALRVDDTGLDLTAYGHAAQVLSHERLCFVNSFSEILCDGWLEHLSAALDLPEAGVAGATGSWGSHRSFAASLLRVLPHGYGDSLGDPAAMAPAFRSLSAGAELGRTRQRLKAVMDIPREIVGFDGFPAPHIRTNAFLIERERLRAMRPGRVARKISAYRFEGGRRGMTGRVVRDGLVPFAVGRDGTAHRPDEWADADLFWQGTQRDLLVADNQTRAYAEGDAAVREALSRYAWGPRARWA